MSLRPFLSFFSVLLLSGFISSAHAEAPESVSGAKTISTTEAKKLFDQSALFIDVRGPSRYTEGHIASAVHLDLEDAFTRTALLQLAEPETPVVLYCDGEECGRSAVAAKGAVGWGFKKIYYFRAGYPGWVRAGYPIEP
jgi:rhodanese-related sulfurtransferase